MGEAAIRVVRPADRSIMAVQIRLGISFCQERQYRSDFRKYAMLEARGTETVPTYTINACADGRPDVPEADFLVPLEREVSENVGPVVHHFFHGRRARRRSSLTRTCLRMGRKIDRKSTRLNSSHITRSRMPSSA